MPDVLYATVEAWHFASEATLSLSSSGAAPWWAAQAGILWSSPARGEGRRLDASLDASSREEGRRLDEAPTSAPLRLSAFGHVSLLVNLDVPPDGRAGEGGPPPPPGAAAGGVSTEVRAPRRRVWKAAVTT